MLESLVAHGHKKECNLRLLITLFCLPAGSLGWSWRDSNSRPNEELICFLHVYLRLNCRGGARPKPPTQTLAFLFQIRAKASPILSPICLHHLIGTLRSHSFRVMSCPRTCARIKLKIYYTSIKQQERNCYCQLNF